jgi:hypothetical protein
MFLHDTYHVSNGFWINYWLFKTMYASNLGCENNEGIALKISGVEMCWTTD